MANLVIATPDYSDKATITGLNDDAAAPATNLQRQKPNDTARTADLTTIAYELDRGEAKPWNLVAMLSANASKTATWRVRAADTQGNLTSAPAFDSFSEIAVNGTFPSDVASWNVNLNGSTGGSVTWDASAAMKILQGTNSVQILVAQAVTLKADTLYVLRAERTAVGGGGPLRVGIASNDEATDLDPDIGFAEWLTTATGAKRLAFTVATAGTYYIKMREGSGIGNHSLVDNISLADDSFRASPGLEDVTRRHALLWVPASVNQRWMRIDVKDPDNGDGFFSTGRLIVANAWQPANNFQYGSKERHEDTARFDKGISGDLLITPGKIKNGAEIQLDFISDAEKRDFLRPLLRLRGASKDMLVVGDPEDGIEREFMMWHGVLKQRGDMSWAQFDTHRARLQIDPL